MPCTFAVAWVAAVAFAVACSAPSAPPTAVPTAVDPCSDELVQLRRLLDAGKLHRTLAVLGKSRCPASRTAELRAEAEGALAVPIAGAGDSQATIAAATELVRTSLDSTVTPKVVAQRNFDRAIAALERATGVPLVLETGHVGGAAREAATTDGRWSVHYNLGVLSLYERATPRYFFTTHLDCGPPTVTISSDGKTLVWKDCETIHFTDTASGTDRRTIATTADIANLYLSDDSSWLVATGAPTLAWQLDGDRLPRELAASGDVVALIPSRHLVVFHASWVSERRHGPHGEPVEEAALMSVDLVTGRLERKVSTTGSVVGGGRTRSDGKLTLFDGDDRLITYDAVTLQVVARGKRSAGDCAAWAEVTRFVPLECDREPVLAPSRPEAIGFADGVLATRVGTARGADIVRWSSRDQVASAAPGAAYVVLSPSAKLAATFDSAGLPAVEDSTLFGPTHSQPPAPLRELRIVDVVTGKLVRTIAVAGCSPRPAHALPEIRFSFDDRWLAYHCGDQAVRLVELASGELALLAHRGPVDAIAFSHRGTTLASSADDHLVRLWDTATGKLTGAFDSGRATTGLAFSADDSELATVAETLVVWGVTDFARRRELPSDQFLLAEDGALLLRGPRPAQGGTWRWVGAIAPVWHGDIELYPKPPRAVLPGGAFVVAQDAIRGMILWRTSDGAVLATLAIYGTRSLLVRDTGGYVDFIGKPMWDEVASCRIGHLALPFAVCEERFHVSGLLAKVVAGDATYRQ